jgi:hypothetical protein
MVEVTLDRQFYEQLHAVWGDELHVKGQEVWVNIPNKPWNYSMSTVTNDLDKLNGFSVNAVRNFDEDKWPEPKFCYYVYMRIQQYKPEFYVRHFYEKIPEGVGIKEFEEEMLYKCRKPAQSGVIPIQFEFDDFKFGTEPCYVCFVLDEATWKFHPDPENEFEETVIFRKSKLISFGKDGRDGARIEFYEPNYSFFNFKRFEIQAIGSDGTTTPRQGFRFVNFMKKDADGNPLNG